MKRIKNKVAITVLAVIMLLTSASYIMSSDVNIVYAAESKAVTDAKAKISHLTKSLKINYLGIKNQGTWELYIGQARELIKKIPNSEKTQRDALTAEVNRAEALVKGLARINQVEKSMLPKSQGGYGNFLGIKNAETWNEYLRLAKIDLEKVDKVIFKKQYDELIGRMNKVSLVVKDIEAKFQVDYDKVVKLYEEAKLSSDSRKAKEALVEAEKLGTCPRSDKLEEDIKKLISEYDNKVVSFKDKALEELIRKEIGKLSGSIYKSDVEKITSIYTKYPCYIKDISGIENLTNLEELDLGFAYVRDIGPLSNLTKLKYLHLGVGVEDLSPLENLINLEDIFIQQSSMSDISALKKLTNLKRLSMGWNQITDISPLENLTNLQYLELYVNQIRDISPLRNLTNLRELSLGDNRIRDISPLKGLTNLEKLILPANKIVDISSLQGLTKLKELNLASNEINDLGSLGSLTNLQELNLDNNQISDISGLRSLINLQELNLYNNQISDISTLNSLINLHTITLVSNQIVDINPLKDLVNLRWISLGDNIISDISPLKNLINLEQLHLDNNKISDVSALKNLTNLKTLIIYGNEVSDKDIEELEKYLVKCDIR